MLAREDWKYEGLKARLEDVGRAFCFEFQMPGVPYVYDLALTDTHVIVEFDARYHATPAQRALDKVRDSAAAEALGWRVVRVPTEANVVLDPSCLDLSSV